MKKVCIFMAIAFLAVDILLLGIYMQARKNYLTVSEDMIDGAVDYLASIQVSVDKRIIKAEIPDNAIYTYERDNTENAEVVSEKISENMFSKDSLISYVETPDGMLCSIADKDGVILSNLRVFTDSNRFIYGADEATEKYYSTMFNTDETLLSGEMQKITDNLMKSLSLENKSTYTITGVREENGMLCVCVVQNIYGKYALENCYANLFFNDGKLVYASGNIIFSDMQKSYREELIDGVNALRELDLHVVSEIHSEDIIYAVRNSGGTTKYLVPVWKITFTDKSGVRKEQLVDAIKN